MFNRMQIAVLLGVVLGIGTPLAAMTLEMHKTEAAVAVFDQKNIEEAIKTAIQTANILTTEQKELALMILDAKKLDLGMLQKWGQKNNDAGGWCKTPAAAIWICACMICCWPSAFPAASTASLTVSFVFSVTFCEAWARSAAA